jgi:hypothetical protein
MAEALVALRDGREVVEAVRHRGEKPEISFTLTSDIWSLTSKGTNWTVG